MKPEAFLKMVAEINAEREQESADIRAGFVIALEAYLQRLEEDASSMLTYASKGPHNAIQMARKYAKTMEEIELLEQWKSLYY